MLTNRRYLGEVVWNAFRWKKTAAGKRRRIPRPASEHVTRRDPDLAIVTQELWDQVQAALPAARSSSGGGRPRALYPLTGLLLCGQCGGSFGAVSRVKKSGRTYRTLGCITRKNRGESICANRHTVSERKVMNALVRHLRERLSRPDRVEAFVKAFREKYAAGAKTPNHEREGLEARVAEKQKYVDGIFKLAANMPDSQMVKDELSKSERALEQLRRQLDAMPKPGPQVLPHPAAIASWVTRLTEIVEARPIEAAAILRRVLTPFRVTHENGRTHLSGALDVGKVCDSSSSGGVI